jgi:S-DNA-T family DNA segregation ATPase FtsK/SpoIIIE
MSHLLQKFKKDLFAVLFFAQALFLGLALGSFNPLDPSFNSIGRGLHVRNFCGFVGSFLADGLYEIFGLGSWMAVLWLARLSVLNVQGEKISLKNLKSIWVALAGLTVCALLALYFPVQRIYSEQIWLGGLVGLGLAKGLTAAFNPIGAQVILWAAALMLTIFYSEKTVTELFLWPLQIGKKMNQWIAKIAPLSALFLSTALKKTKKKKNEMTVLRANDNRPEPSLLRGLPLVSEETLPALVDKPQILKIGNDGQYELPVQTLDFESAAKNASGDAQKDAQGPRRRVVEPVKVERRIENWQLPKLKLLMDPPSTRVKIDEKEIKKKAEILKEKLACFEVTGEVVAAKPGPAVTMFEFRPDANVKVAEVKALENDLSLALSSESLRILAPIPGRDVVGIETSNAQRETVYFKDMLAAEDFWRDDVKLPVALGKTSTGEAKIVDLRKMPHLMVAGTTGSGKSVFTVSLIMGLIYRHSPKTLKIIIVDPKQVDYAAFEKIPHLSLPIITENREAVSALKWAVIEMEKRYRSMSEFGARGLEAFNETVAKLSKEDQAHHDMINETFEQTPGKRAEKYYFQPQPYIVIILEEFGDLMSVDKSAVEHSVVRLAQKARACGMHLVLATQSPRKEVVTGLIKTNIPGRISFKVGSPIDSRVILDENGAERLLASGDMLFKSPGTSSLIRHHAPFLSEPEIADVCSFWAQQGEPSFDPSAMKAIDGREDSTDAGSAAEGADAEYDDKYDEILAWAAAQKTVSASLIQRRFSIGYPRAARIIETFEREGVVSAQNGSKPRQVLVNNLANLGE